MNSTPSRPTSAYYLQAIMSFALALTVVIIGVICLPLPVWTRAFFALGTLFLVSSSFTLAKCVRDRQEAEPGYQRLEVPSLPPEIFFENH
jgi:hypothetical protein